jgi:hypothetical protein
LADEAWPEVTVYRLYALILEIGSMLDRVFWSPLPLNQVTEYETYLWEEPTSIITGEGWCQTPLFALVVGESL